MVVADLEHIEHQVSMTPSFWQAVDFLRRKDLGSLSDGKVEIDGDNVFALVQRYVTTRTDTVTFECHRRYIDVQYVVSGEELIGWAPTERMTVSRAYDGGKDICFGSVPTGRWTALYLEAGRAAVFWPEDSHAPKLAGRAPSPVMKVVVKVAVSPGRAQDAK